MDSITVLKYKLNIVAFIQIQEQTVIVIIKYMETRIIFKGKWKNLKLIEIEYQFHFSILLMQMSWNTS